MYIAIHISTRKHLIKGTIISTTHKSTGAMIHIHTYIHAISFYLHTDIENRSQYDISVIKFLTGSSNFPTTRKLGYLATSPSSSQESSNPSEEDSRPSGHRGEAGKAAGKTHGLSRALPWQPERSCIPSSDHLYPLIRARH